MTGRLQQFWVFGYGSLMWRPGFAHLRPRPARLSCMAITGVCASIRMSIAARPNMSGPGARSRPRRFVPWHGLRVDAGQSRGDACLSEGARAGDQGLSGSLDADSAAAPQAEPVEAVTYVVDRAHRAICGAAAVEAQLAYVARATASQAAAATMSMSTLDHLREMEHSRPPARATGGDTCVSARRRRSGSPNSLA